MSVISEINILHSFEKFKIGISQHTCISFKHKFVLPKPSVSKCHIHVNKHVFLRVLYIFFIPRYHSYTILPKYVFTSSYYVTDDQYILTPTSRF